MRRLPVLLLLLLLPLKALALSCSATISDVSFGNVDVLSASNPLTTSNGSVSITCTRNLVLELLSGSVKLCIGVGAGTGGVNAGPTARQMASGANKLLFNLYTDAGLSTIWGSSSVFTATGPRVFSLNPPVTGLGSQTITDSIYGAVNASQALVPVGSYSSSFSGSNTEVRYGYGSAACSSLPSSTTAPFAVNATVIPNCTITAGTMDFGSVGLSLMTTNADATSSITTTCTSAAAYQIALDNGLNYSSPNRRMANAGNRANYELYRDSGRTQRWGSTLGTDTVSGAGTGASVAATVYGRVPAQTGIAIGSYTDTVVATISF